MDGRYRKKKKEIKEVLKSKGIANVDWNALTGDAEGKKTTEEQLKKFEETRKGETALVVLMHDASDKKATPETAREIKVKASKKHLLFLTSYVNIMVKRIK